MLKRTTCAVLISALLIGCVPTAGRVTSAPAAFEDGMAALRAQNFPLASYHFAELAKGGDPSSMNNLGVALLMANRKDEAIYWFQSAARYGDPNAPATLRRLGESVPAADLVGKHPSQVSQQATQDILAILAAGALIGITAYYSGKSGGGYNYAPIIDSPSMSSSNRESGNAYPARAARAESATGSVGYQVKKVQIERDIEVTNIYTRETYSGSVDRFGNVTIHPKNDPGNRYKGTYDAGSAKVRNSSGDELTIQPR